MTPTGLPAPGGGHLWAERVGTGMDSRLWDAIVVIRYGARGLGRSTPPERTCTPG